MQPNTANKLATLNEAVSPGDLILLFAMGQRAVMLLVESSSGTQSSNPQTSSITVREVKEEDDYTADDEDTTTEARCDDSVGLLSAYMTSFPAECRVEYCVNPHGRHVHQYYWGDDCPFCHSDNGSYCPVCLGYDFALDDKCALREIEDYEDRIRRGEFGFEGGPAEMKLKILMMVRERYECINAKKGEIGFNSHDVDEIVENWFKDGGDE
ncbi:hypothetical protein ABOM_000787 [Aspergillus bombycis]|uniref:Uncharacterized protein n=1 Tax=Aspergillus bombycis TaxID=109264 RepID=A0A1F8AG58_9EURO|nr:hypothetical protein ABOM_000787 [Aspergillus bombycis]OGM50667.1 hypothetical protein ABOM_000787 [Aspergillus bombycis]